ncbi:MAG TPA: tyrosine--tRNA ligase [Longimicrobiales bacterium]|nr:tyrosine--tRNA ligase [Longimicrobiales bacterium]
MPSSGPAGVLDELRWRGLLQDVTEGTAEHLSGGARTGYIGFDPTASSLHVGTLLPIMGLVHLQRAGHHAIALVGGGTGLIGDPSGKVSERKLLGSEETFANAEAIHRQLEHFLDFGVRPNPARMRNNYDWLGQIPLVDFLRDIGKHFSVNAMLRKESVKRRVESDEEGISFTEFSYQLLQSYDFLELFRREGCTVQMGGSDQWGNITAGIDLIRRMEGAPAFGATFPLLQTSAGTKFGKTEAGTVWLDPVRTSPYRFYQFWINADDPDALQFLRFFTLLPREEIEALDAATAEAPERRAAQKTLAEDVTRRVHGEDGLQRARRATDALFGGELAGLSAEDIADVFADVPSSDADRGTLAGEGKPIVELLTDAGIAPSRAEAKRQVEGGGIYLNSLRVGEIEQRVRIQDAIEGRFLVLRKGKKSYHLVRVVG